MYELSEPKSKGRLYQKTSSGDFCDCIDDALIKKVLNNNLTNLDKQVLFVNTVKKGKINLKDFDALLSKSNRICKFKASKCGFKIQVEVYSKISDPLRPMGTQEFNQILNSL